MFYIIFDLEFNQDFSSLQNFERKSGRPPFEIIQIGAVKLDDDFKTVGAFDAYVKPFFYSQINPFVTELTGITSDRLEFASGFKEVYKEFIIFTGGTDAVLGIWGMSDLKELFRNAAYHQLDQSDIPRMFINIQPYVSKYFNVSSKKLFKLENAVRKLNIPVSSPFHNAFYDAYYTAEVFKKIHHPFIQPVLYDPCHKNIRPKQLKRQVDFEALILQFEKMYSRQMAEEEKSMIKLAYKMGKTHQFLK